MTEKRYRLDLSSELELHLAIDAEFDVAVFHLGPPTEAITEFAGSGRYLRLANGRVAGLEIHGLERLAGLDPAYADLFEAARDEWRHQPSRREWTVVAPLAHVPATRAFLAFVIGQALHDIEDEVVVA